MVGEWSLSEYSVCPHPLLQFLQFFQFMSVRLRQVTSGYVSLRWRDGTWSSTIGMWVIFVNFIIRVRGVEKTIFEAKENKPNCVKYSIL